LEEAAGRAEPIAAIAGARTPAKKEARSELLSDRRKDLLNDVHNSRGLLAKCREKMNRSRKMNTSRLGARVMSERQEAEWTVSILGQWGS
jgi:hypothetical protein